MSHPFLSHSEICKWLDILFFSDKEEKSRIPSRTTFTDLIIVGR